MLRIKSVGVGPTLHIWTDIQTDGDYIKRVVHGPPGDHTLKNPDFIPIQQHCFPSASSKLDLSRPSNTVRTLHNIHHNLGHCDVHCEQILSFFVPQINAPEQEKRNQNFLFTEFICLIQHHNVENEHMVWVSLF